MRGIDKKMLCIRSFTVSFPDQMTRIEFEADLLKDEKVEREEEVNESPLTRFETNILKTLLQMRLQKAELLKLVEVCSVLHEARSADQQRIARFSLLTLLSIFHIDIL